MLGDIPLVLFLEFPFHFSISRSSSMFSIFLDISFFFSIFVFSFFVDGERAILGRTVQGAFHKAFMGAFHCGGLVSIGRCSYSVMPECPGQSI